MREGIDAQFGCGQVCPFWMYDIKAGSAALEGEGRTIFSSYMRSRRYWVHTFYSYVSKAEGFDRVTQAQ
jgi:hypothetical protein